MGVDHNTYAILHLLAVGGMAEVYLARQRIFPGIERLVVVKRLRPEHRDDDEYITMFLDEARIAARLQHPHVAQLYDATYFQDDMYLVMEFVDGVSLRQLIDAASAAGRRLSIGEAAGIGLTLADTLAFVHEAKDEHGLDLRIVHRDLTPRNVLVSWTGAIKLIDFGIARGENRVYETATGMVKGTAGYMAPEQLQEGVPDARTDIFALGVCLYELFTGAHPFVTRNLFDLYDTIIQGRFESPRAKRADLPIRAEVLISRCLQPDPKRRPQSMREVAVELALIVAGTRHIPTFHCLSNLVNELLPRLSPSERPVQRCDDDVDMPTKLQRKS